jgi:hypothetical protein
MGEVEDARYVRLMGKLIQFGSGSIVSRAMKGAWGMSFGVNE